jgi:cephalosporin-C deacetylase
MPAFDLPPAQLRGYRSAVEAPADLDAFWDATLAEARRRGTAPTAERVDSGLTLVDAFDVTFSGFDGEPIRAWLHRPAGSDADIPAVVRFIGYECGRGLPHDVHPLALAGYAVLSVDNRGQGALAGYRGDTPDSDGTLRQLGGHLGRGVFSPETYYYRRLLTDAARAVDAVRELPGIDAGRIAVHGVSQGGGIALAASALATGVTAAMIDVPFLCDLPRALDLATVPPYLELVKLLGTYPDRIGDVRRTLAYVDGAVLATRATAPALFSVGLMDAVCPPSTVYAAYNAYAGPKEIREYPFNGHEGGSFLQEAVQLAWLRTVMPVHP